MVDLFIQTDVPHIRQRIKLELDAEFRSDSMKLPMAATPMATAVETANIFALALKPDTMVESQKDNIAQHLGTIPSNNYPSQSDTDSNLDILFQDCSKTRNFIKASGNFIVHRHRDKCPDQLKAILPLSDNYSYVIEDFKAAKHSSPDNIQFDATVRINLTSKEEADQWLSEFMSYSSAHTESQRHARLL